MQNCIITESIKASVHYRDYRQTIDDCSKNRSNDNTHHEQHNRPENKISIKKYKNKYNVNIPSCH